MNDQLTALDATFLELEEGDEVSHMHVGALMVFEPPADGRVPTLEDVCTHLEERLVALPRYRQRLSERHTGGLRWPHWEDDPRFDIANHVTRAALPAPQGDRELFEWASDYWSHRLDRARPLWDIVLIEKLEGGRWALASKTHHCMVDGVSSVDVGYVLLDGERDPGPIDWSPPAHSGNGNGHGFVRTSAGALAHALDPRNLPELLHRSRAAVSMLVRDELIGAPHTSINDPIGAQRRIAAVKVGLDELKEIKRELGGTVNDVALSIVTGGLRRLMLARGEEPPAGVRAMVPVDIRGASEHMELGNRVTSLFAHLPVAEPDALSRYVATRIDTKTLKESTEAEGGKAVVDFTALAPPVIHAAIARGLFASRLFNLTVTNIPGPPEPLYAFGCAVDQVFGLVPLFADHAVGVAVVSYAGEVTFTVAADHDSVPDLAVLVDGMREELAELRGLVAARPALHAS